MYLWRRSGGMPASGVRKVLDPDRIVVAVAVHRDRGRDADRFDAADRLDACGRSARACAPPAPGSLIDRRRNRDAQRQHALRDCGSPAARRGWRGTCAPSARTRPAAPPPARPARRPACCARDGARGLRSIRASCPSAPPPSAAARTSAIGIAPNSSPATSEMPIVKASTIGSIVISLSRGSCAGCR